MGNLQIEMYILQIDRLNPQIAWPILQIVPEILKIAQDCTADTARF